MRFLSAASQKVSRAVPATLLKYSVLMVVYLHDSHFSVLGKMSSRHLQARVKKDVHLSTLIYSIDSSWNKCEICR